MGENTRSAKSTTKQAAKKAAPRADKADGESAVLATIAAMLEPDRALAERLHMWPTAFALKELTAAEEARIGALVKKAVS
jgi:hypothetical protein